MRWLRSLAAISLACALGAQAVDARAQAGSDPQAAIAEGEEGMRLFSLGRWNEAYARFEAADRLAHSPVFVLFMARCRRNAGKLLEAQALFGRVAAERVAPGAPEPMRRAPREARAERDELAHRIPSIVIVVTGAGSDSASVRLDGSPLAPGAIRRAIPLDPGVHRVEARAAGSAAAVRSVELREGDAPARVVLELGAGREQPQPSAEPDSRGSALPGAIVLGAGIAGLGLGAVTGGIAASKTSALKERCVGVHCPPEDADEADRARTFATVSSVSFAIGGVLVAGGVVLLITRPGGSTQAAVAAGPGRISFQARF
jgi:hypothetical protein